MERVVSDRNVVSFPFCFIFIFIQITYFTNDFSGREQRKDRTFDRNVTFFACDIFNISKIFCHLTTHSQGNKLEMKHIENETLSKYKLSAIIVR